MTLIEIKMLLIEGTDQDRDQYLSHPNASIREEAISRHKSPTTEQLIKASNDRSPIVRLAVAGRKFPIAHFTSWLLREQDDTVYQKLLMNSHFPSHIHPIRVVSGLSDEALTIEQLWETFNAFKPRMERSKDHHSASRMRDIFHFVAKHPACTDELHQAIFSINDPHVDPNRGMPPHIYVGIAKHPNPSVESICKIQKIKFDANASNYTPTPGEELVKNLAINQPVWDEVFSKSVPSVSAISVLAKELRVSGQGLWNGVENIRAGGHSVSHYIEGLHALIKNLTEQDVRDLLRSERLDLSSKCFAKNYVDVSLGEYLMRNCAKEYELILSIMLSEKLQSSNAAGIKSASNKHRNHV